MLNLVRHTNNSKKIIQDGYSLLLVSHVNELQNEELSFLDGFIINTDSQIYVKEIITSIRTHSNIKIALKPVFINAIYRIPKEIEIHLDGAVELSMTKYCSVSGMLGASANVTYSSKVISV